MNIIFKFFILFFFISINIIFATCDPRENSAGKYESSGTEEDTVISVLYFIALGIGAIFIGSIAYVCHRIEKARSSTESNEPRNNRANIGIPSYSSPATVAEHLIDPENTPHANLSINKDLELPTYESLFPDRPTQVTSTSINHT